MNGAYTRLSKVHSSKLQVYAKNFEAYLPVKSSWETSTSKILHMFVWCDLRYGWTCPDLFPPSCLWLPLANFIVWRFYWYSCDLETKESKFIYHSCQFCTLELLPPQEVTLKLKQRRIPAIDHREQGLKGVDVIISGRQRKCLEVKVTFQ